jgi:adhesin/invasin
VAGAPNSAKSSLQLSPNAVIADGAPSSTAVLTVRDAMGNPVPQTAATFSCVAPGVILPTTTGTTDANGMVQIMLEGTVAGSATVVAQGPNYLVNAPIVFLPGPPNAGTSTLTVSPPSVAADGVSTALLILVARDAQGNRVPGQSVVPSASGASTSKARWLSPRPSPRRWGWSR